MTPHARYAPLNRYLAGLPVDRQTLSFNEIESIVGRPLPPSASGAHGPQWWANTSTHSQGQAWMAAGWRVESVDLPARQIRFRRVDPPVGVSEAGAPAPTVPSPVSPLSDDTVSVPRRALSARASRMIADYAEATGGDEASAIVQIVEHAALERRRQLLARFAEMSPRLQGDSTALIREDRDAH